MNPPPDEFDEALKAQLAFRANGTFPAILQDRDGQQLSTGEALILPVLNERIYPPQTTLGGTFLPPLESLQDFRAANLPAIAAFVLLVEVLHEHPDDFGNLYSWEKERPSHLSFHGEAWRALSSQCPLPSVGSASPHFILPYHYLASIIFSEKVVDGSGEVCKSSLSLKPFV